jgi:hypothetical protein
MTGGRETTAPVAPAAVVPAGRLSPGKRKRRVLVWHLSEAPNNFRKLTAKRGDYYLVAIPAALGDAFYPPAWLFKRVEEYKLANGDRVLIGE